MNYPSRHLTRRSTIVGLLAGATLPAAVGLVGCQRQTNEPASGQPNLFKLSMQAPWINDAEFIGYFVAMSEGLFVREGLDFEYLSGGPSKIADQVLAAGNAMVALTNPETTVNMILKEKAPFKIIGTQYQKSPLGIVSLKKNNIFEPKDLVGKRVAVPDANRVTLDAFLRLNKIDPASVKTYPYAYDPTPLIKGIVDATVDFVTNVPFSIREAAQGPSQEPTSFLFYDFGFRVFMDTVVVREEAIAANRDRLVAFLRASRKGWEENFSNFEKYPPKFMNSYFKGTNRTVENEIYFNKAQRPLMESSTGYFSMSDKDIEGTIESLNRIGIGATRSMFDTTLLKAI